MKLSIYIQELLKKKSGCNLRLPSDIEVLTLDIESKTDEHLGVNTMKRLLGLIDDERTPRTSTLDIIAHYLGYDNWDVLSKLDDKSNSDFDGQEDEIRVDTLTTGQRIQVEYLPDRRIVMQYQGNRHFVVMDSENSKLRHGDELELTHLVKGYPMLVNQVLRNGASLGSYTAGKTQGIIFKLL